MAKILVFSVGKGVILYGVVDEVSPMPSMTPWSARYDDLGVSKPSMGITEDVLESPTALGSLDWRS